MGIDLPSGGNIFLPEVPKGLEETSPEVFKWMKSVRKELIRQVNEMFSNDLHISTAINSGTSGTFTISSGGSIVVTSGIVINVTS